MNGILRFFLLVTTLAASRAQAEEPKDSAAASELQASVQRCFSPPAGATESASIAVTFEADGSVKDDPKVVRQGSGPINENFARAAVRAVLRCAPYDLNRKDRMSVTFNFIPSETGKATGLNQATEANFVVMADNSRIAYRLLDGLCALDRSRGGIDAKIWESNPFHGRDAAVVGIAIDCASLDTARKGDFSRPPNRFVTVAEMGKKPEMPSGLEEFVAFLDRRDRNRYMPTETFFENPKPGGATYVGRDEYAAYYGYRNIDKNGNIEGTGISSYTLVAGHPLVIFDFRYDGSDITDATRIESARLVEGFHTLNR
jgi:hypothetical protein